MNTPATIPTSPYDYLFVAGATAIIYFFILGAIILFGKKELSQLSIIDLVFILLISNSVQNAMVNSRADDLWKGLIAAITLFVLNFIMKNAMFRNQALSKIIEGQPVMLIYHGKVIQENVAKEKITPEELEAAVREHGVAEITDVNLAILEPDGNISVISISGTKQIPFRKKSRKIPARIKQ